MMSMYMYYKGLSPLQLWVRIPLIAMCTLCDKSLSVTCDRSVIFSRYSKIKLMATINWNIVESDVKHHNPNPIPQYCYQIKIVMFNNKNTKLKRSILTHMKCNGAYMQLCKVYNFMCVWITVLFEYSKMTNILLPNKNIFFHLLTFKGE